jgi:hypothetical protein
MLQLLKTLILQSLLLRGHLLSMSHPGIMEAVQNLRRLLDQKLLLISNNKAIIQLVEQLRDHSRGLDTILLNTCSIHMNPRK